MKKYQEVRAIALTVSQMLSLQLAISDAVSFNTGNDFPQHAKEYQALLEAIRKQTDAWIGAADAEIQEHNANLMKAIEEDA